MSQERILIAGPIRAELRRDPSSTLEDLPKALGVSPKAVDNSVRYLRKIGELPKRTPEELHQIRSIKSSQARGGMGLLVGPYIEEGMRDPRLIQESLQNDKGIELDLDKIKKILYKQVSRGKIESLRTDIKSVWQQIRPLVLRGGISSEIVKLTGYKATTVEHAIAQQNRFDNPIEDYNSNERIKARRKRKSEVGRNTQYKDRRHQNVYLESARELLNAGFFDDNLEIWNSIQEKLKEKGKRVGDRFNYLLVMEAAFKMPQQTKEDILLKKKERRAREEAERLNKPLAIRGLSVEDIENLVFNIKPELEDPNEINALLFARELIREGFIEESTKYWDFDKSLRDGERGSSQNPSSALVRESYIRARVEEMNGDRGLMIKYYGIGKSIDAKWFGGEAMSLLRGSLKYKLSSLTNLG